MANSSNSSGVISSGFISLSGYNLSSSAFKLSISFINSCTCSCNLVLYFSIAFFHTNVYLFAFASIFVPSTKYSSVLIYPFFSSTISNSTKTSSIITFILSFLNELITFLVGLLPPANHMNFISDWTSSAICLEEYLFLIYPYINIFNITFGE